MTHTRSPKITKERLSLFDLISSGQASEADVITFENLLRDDPESRTAYICYCDMEAELKHRATRVVSNSDLKMRPRRAVSFPMAAMIAFGLFLAASLVFGIVRVNRYADRSELDEVAIVTRLENASFSGYRSALKVGDRLRPGNVRIQEGLLQLSFFSGADVMIEGPAKIRLGTINKLILTEGKVSAYIREDARGFEISTGKHSIIDWGTKVSVHADANGEVETYVHEGAVQFNYLGNDGATSNNQMLTRHEKLAVNRNNESSLLSGDFSGQFPAVQFPQPTVLDIPPSYIEAVLADGPVLYWRFESAFGGTVPNEATGQAGSSLDGRISGEIELFGATGNKAWFQRNPRNGVFVSSAGPVPAINKNGYTIEMWVNPMEFRRAALASLMDPNPYLSAPNSSYLNHHHLAYLELMNVGSSYVHPANSFRYLHRWPPSTEGSIGKNIFEPGYLPGKWTHLVAVRTASDRSGSSEQLLYLNGELVARDEVEQPENDLNEYMFVIGRLDPARNERGLVGLIDEVALYPRPLTPSEISSHYKLVVPY